MVTSGKEAFVLWTLDEKWEKRKPQSQWLELDIESKFILPTCFGIPSLKMSKNWSWAVDTSGVIGREKKTIAL